MVEERQASTAVLTSAGRGTRGAVGCAKIGEGAASGAAGSAQARCRRTKLGASRGTDSRLHDLVTYEVRDDCRAQLDDVHDHAMPFRRIRPRGRCSLKVPAPPGR